MTAETKEHILEIEGALSSFYEVIKDFDEMVRISKKYNSPLEKSFVVNALQQLFSAENRIKESISNRGTENEQKFFDGTLVPSIKVFMSFTTKGTNGEYDQLEWQLCELRQLGLKTARIAKGLIQDQLDPNAIQKQHSRRSKSSQQPPIEPEILEPLSSSSSQTNIPSHNPTHTSLEIQSPKNQASTHSPREHKQTFPTLKISPKTEDPSKTRHRPLSVSPSQVSPRKVEFTQTPSGNKLRTLEKSEKSTEGWVCESCKFRNNFSTIQCVACHKKRPVPTDSWACLSCQTFNPLTNKKCNMCGMEAPAITPLIHENWVCQVCHVTQSGTTEKCALCGAFREQAIHRRSNRKSDPGHHKKMIVPFSQT